MPPGSRGGSGGRAKGRRVLAWTWAMCVRRAGGALRMHDAHAPRIEAVRGDRKPQTRQRAMENGLPEDLAQSLALLCLFLGQQPVVALTLGEVHGARVLEGLLGHDLDPLVAARDAVATGRVHGGKVVCHLMPVGTHLGWLIGRIAGGGHIDSFGASGRVAPWTLYASSQVRSNSRDPASAKIRS